MASLSDATKRGRFSGPASPSPLPSRAAAPQAGTLSQANTISASAARAARRRAARRDEQAVAAWLRELAGHTR